MAEQAKIVYDFSKSYCTSVKKTLEENLVDITDKTTPVLNHECEGLKLLSRFGEENNCTPRVREDGFITACDDTNPIRINFCPMCGVELEDGRD